MFSECEFSKSHNVEGFLVLLDSAGPHRDCGLGFETTFWELDVSSLTLFIVFCTLLTYLVIFLIYFLNEHVL